MALYRSLALYCRLKFHRWRLDVLSLTTRGDLGSWHAPAELMRISDCVVILRGVARGVNVINITSVTSAVLHVTWYYLLRPPHNALEASLLRQPPAFPRRYCPLVT